MVVVGIAQVAELKFSKKNLGTGFLEDFDEK